jgi:hypothetical protein
MPRRAASHSIARSLHSAESSPLGTIQWVLTAYMLAFASVIPLTGRATEGFGAERVWLLSLAPVHPRLGAHRDSVLDRLADRLSGCCRGSAAGRSLPVGQLGGLEPGKGCVDDINAQDGLPGARQLRAIPAHAPSCAPSGLLAPRQHSHRTSQSRRHSPVWRPPRGSSWLKRSGQDPDVFAASAMGRRPVLARVMATRKSQSQ